jgi:hypothetical protein
MTPKPMAAVPIEIASRRHVEQQRLQRAADGRGHGANQHAGQNHPATLVEHGSKDVAPERRSLS